MDAVDTATAATCSCRSERSRVEPTASRPSGKRSQPQHTGKDTGRSPTSSACLLSCRPGLAAPCPSERRDRHEPGEHHPDRRGPLRSGVTSPFRHPAGNDGPHGWCRNRSLETSVLVPDIDLGAGLHATPGRVCAHRRLVADRQRAGLSPVLAPWLNSPRVCFGGPGNEHHDRESGALPQRPSPGTLTTEG